MSNDSELEVCLELAKEYMGEPTHKRRLNDKYGEYHVALKMSSGYVLDFIGGRERLRMEQIVGDDNDTISRRMFESPDEWYTEDFEAEYGDGGWSKI